MHCVAIWLMMAGVRSWVIKMNRLEGFMVVADGIKVRWSFAFACFALIPILEN